MTGELPPFVAVVSGWCGPGHRQITTLEILAISVGLSTFQELLSGRKVVVWTDNKGAEGAARGGRAKAWDHCRLIHEMWLHALQNGTHVWIERVPSHDNISDSPSRYVRMVVGGWDVGVVLFAGARTN